MVSSSEWHFGALVHHAAGLVVPARQRPGLGDLHADPQPQPRAQALAEPRAQPVALRAGQRGRRIDAHEDVVQAFVAPEDDLELVDLRVGPHQLLDPARVDDDAPHLLHVVEAGVYAALESHERAPAGTLPVGYTVAAGRAGHGGFATGAASTPPVFGGPPAGWTPTRPGPSPGGSG